MPNPPTPNVPGMTDTLEFVKNLWGSMNVPGVAMPGMSGPTLSTDELDKKIADLRAVESWLLLNTTMLRGTIQALEVQRGTIATLKSMGASMAQAMGQPGAAGAASPFAQFFNPPAAAAAPAPSGAQPQQPAQAAAPGLPPSAAAMPAAVSWWNLLQEQFTQAVASAMSPEVMAGATAMAQDAAARFAATAPAPAGKDAGPAASAGPGAAERATDAGQAATGAAQGAGPTGAKPRAAKPKAENG